MRWYTTRVDTEEWIVKEGRKHKLLMENCASPRGRVESVQATQISTSYLQLHGVFETNVICLTHTHQPVGVGRRETLYPIKSGGNPIKRK